MGLGPDCCLRSSERSLCKVDDFVYLFIVVFRPMLDFPAIRKYLGALCAVCLSLSQGV
jgi:hypothetical protein